MRKRIALVAAIALAVVAIAGGAVAYSASSKHVTLSVDGRAEQVKTFAGTVEELLADRGIEVGRHDAVAPSLQSRLTEGTHIAVRYGRRLHLTVDGDPETYWVTATSVDMALDQLGLRFTDADMSASRSAPIGRQGIDLTVKTEKDITVLRRDRKLRRATTAVTVGEALRDLGIDYDGNDRISPRVGTEIDDGSTLRLVRIEKERVKDRQAVANETVVRYDDDLLEGRERVVRPGRDGVRVVTYEVVRADGKVTDRRTVHAEVRTRPVDRIEVHGTKEPPSPEPAADTSGGLSGAPCASGSSVESGLTSNAIAVHRAVCAEFPEISSYGGLRPGDDGEHGEGRALDVMISDSATGDAVAEFVRAHAGALGVSEVIWSQRIWSSERSSEGWRYMEDMGSATANHYDHVHVTVY